MGKPVTSRPRRRTFVAIAATLSLFAAACGGGGPEALDVDDIEDCDALAAAALEPIEESFSELIGSLNELRNTSEVGPDQIDPFNESLESAMDPLNERRQDLGCADDFLAEPACEAIGNVRSEVTSAVAQEAFAGFIDPIFDCG